MWKKLAVSLIVYAVAGTSLVWSQTPPAQGSTQPPAAGGGSTAPSNAPTPEDVAALSDARLAALKIGLKIKPDQEKNWTSFETTIRDLAKQRQDRFTQLVKDRQNPPKGQTSSPADVLRVRAKSMTQAAGDLTRYADAIDPLYKTLDDDQKHRMLVLMTALTPRR
jgi:zinc resistance-associated protein